MRYLLKVFQFHPLKQNQPMEIDVQDIDHLGIIAGIVDEVGIVEIINRLLGNHPLEQVSAGHVVLKDTASHIKALILNCLGFLTAPLYLFSQFFLGKATEHLIGEGVKPEHLNDKRGFRFLKDPLFFASRMFVKLPQRVAALAMIMGLCLLVYSIGQRQLRSSLAEAIETIPNQRGKPTERPTLRWVLQCFQSLHLVWVSGRKWSIKLTDTQRHILRFLGSACQKYSSSHTGEVQSFWF